MAKTLFDYPVSDPYGATYSPWSKIKPHLGDDHKAPKRTPIEISGVTVGYVGMSGKASGYHTHVQLLDKNGAVANPNGGGGKITGEVIKTGYTSIRGYFVDIKDDKGQIWSDFHMDEPALVKVGDKIGGNMSGINAVKPTAKQVDDTINQIRILGGYPDSSLNVMLSTYRDLFKNNYVSGVQTMLDQCINDKNRPIAGFTPYTGSVLYIKN